MESLAQQRPSSIVNASSQPEFPDSKNYLSSFQKLHSEVYQVDCDKSEKRAIHELSKSNKWLPSSSPNLAFNNDTKTSHMKRSSLSESLHLFPPPTLSRSSEICIVGLPSLFSDLLSRVPGLIFADGPILSRHSYMRDIHASLISASYGRLLRRLSQPCSEQANRNDNTPANAGTSHKTNNGMLIENHPTILSRSSSKIDSIDASKVTVRRAALNPIRGEHQFGAAATTISEGCCKSSSITAMGNFKRVSLEAGNNVSKHDTRASNSNHGQELEKARLSTSDHKSLGYPVDLRTQPRDVDALLSKIMRKGYELRFHFPTMDNLLLWGEVCTQVDWLEGMPVQAIAELGAEIMCARRRYLKVKAAKKVSQESHSCAHYHHHHHYSKLRNLHRFSKKPDRQQITASKDMRLKSTCFDSNWCANRSQQEGRTARIVDMWIAWWVFMHPGARWAAKSWRGK